MTRPTRYTAPAGWPPLPDAALAIGVSRQRMWRLVRDGRVVARQVGGWWLVESHSALEYAIEFGRPRVPHANGCAVCRPKWTVCKCGRLR